MQLSLAGEGSPDADRLKLHPERAARSQPHRQPPKHGLQLNAATHSAREERIMTENNLEGWKPIAEVSAELRIPHRTIYNWQKAKKLESRKVGGRTLVHVEAARALLACRDAAKTPASPGNAASNGRQQANGAISTHGTPRDLAAKGFRALQEGARPEDLVHLGMLPDEAISLTDSVEKLQAAGMKPGSKLNARLESTEQRLELVAHDLATGNFTLAGQVTALQEQVEQLRSAMVQFVECRGRSRCPRAETSSVTRAEQWAASRYRLGVPTAVR
jgi:hypothetical protein